jgi:hypothetical protein
LAAGAVGIGSCKGDGGGGCCARMAAECQHEHPRDQDDTRDHSGDERTVSDKPERFRKRGTECHVILRRPELA